MVNTEIKYILLDVEVWHHQKGEYPHRTTPTHDTSTLVIGTQYSAEEYAYIEKDISAHYNNQGYNTELMNPLYQYGGKMETVLTIDLQLQRAVKKNPNNASINKSAWFRDILTLTHDHQAHVAEIHAYGGNLELERVYNVFLSRDPVLRSLENKVQNLCAGHTDTLIIFAQNGCIEACMALQWLCKDQNLLEQIINLLKEGLPTDCINILLRQLIPCITDMPSETQERLTKTLAILLQCGVSNVRNKALSILSDMDRSVLVSLPNECITFIKEVSLTKQINCSYPAKEILEKLKAPEA